MSPPLFVAVLLALLVIPSTAVHALESDRDQKAWIDADEVDLDFATGKRIYRGNVSIKQGTIRIIADEVELFYQGEQLEKAIARGNPAVFRQRPEQKLQDVIGQGKKIELDEINNIVTFFDQATIRQGSDTISGDTIVYDMAQDKMKVRGQTRTTKAPEQPKVNSSQPSTTLVTSGSDRPRIVLQPRSKETSAATVANTGSHWCERHVDCHSFNQPADLAISCRICCRRRRVDVWRPQSGFTVHWRTKRGRTRKSNHLKRRLVQGECYPRSEGVDLRSLCVRTGSNRYSLRRQCTLA